MMTFVHLRFRNMLLAFANLGAKIQCLHKLNRINLEAMILYKKRLIQTISLFVIIVISMFHSMNV